MAYTPRNEVVPKQEYIPMNTEFLIRKRDGMRDAAVYGKVIRQCKYELAMATVFLCVERRIL